MRDSLALAHGMIEADWPNLAYTTNGSLTGTMRSGIRSPNDSIQAEVQTSEVLDGWVRSGGVMTHTFWFTGTGIGDIIVTVPYRMSVDCNGDVEVFGQIRLTTGPGGGFLPMTETLHCKGPTGFEFREGQLVLARPMFNPTFGPLVSFQTAAEVRASVPEVTADLLILTTLLLFTASFAAHSALVLGIAKMVRFVRDEATKVKVKTRARNNDLP